MADTITFNDGSNPAVTIPVPDYPSDQLISLQQNVQVAMGGRVTSVTNGSGTLTRWALRWNSLPTANYNTLKTFLYTTVAGATTQFTYTDENSSNYTVKYIGGLETASLVDFNSFEVEILLAEIP
tara:strand:+ start:481 stop:855 length:375 start_codon:yes stop_codon:yes gene_type:complete